MLISYYKFWLESHSNGGQRLNVNEIIDAELIKSKNFVIYAAQRQVGTSDSNKTSPIFIYNESSFKADVGDRAVYYVTDGNNIRGLTIENVINIKDGKIVSHKNEIGLTDSRDLWRAILVFKVNE